MKTKLKTLVTAIIVLLGVKGATAQISCPYTITNTKACGAFNLQVTFWCNGNPCGAPVNVSLCDVPGPCATANVNCTCPPACKPDRVTINDGTNSYNFPAPPPTSGVASPCGTWVLSASGGSN